MSKKTLNKANLEALGASQLADLLIEVSTGSADIKRRLRLELSHNLGPAELAHDVRKRLTSLRKATSFIGWRKRKAFIKDLSTQVAMITDKIGPDDPAAAFDLLWEFIDLAPSIFERVDDSRGEVGDVFRAAFDHFADLTARALPAPEALADRVWAAVQGNEYGQWDGVIALMAPALGQGGLARLKSHVQDYADAPQDPQGEDHEAIQFLRQLRGGATYAAERKARFVKTCLQEIAVATGDAQAYIAQYTPQDLHRKDIAAEVAVLLLEDGRPEDALAALQNADQDPQSLGQDAWDSAYIATLLALDRDADAQAHRWSCFTATLNAQHLREHLKALPDFDDVEAEDRAKAHVLAFPNSSAALRFCLDWPDLLTAAQLIETRPGDINGDHHGLLAPVADALRTRHPRAAVTLWRAMIDHTLEGALSFRYAAAADYLADCAALDGEITDYGTAPRHGDYVEVLRTRHGRKASFWQKTL